MLHELENILERLKKTEQMLHHNIYKEGEIQEQINEIYDFPELLSDVHQKLSILQQPTPQELAKILKTLISLNYALSGCINHIELTRELVNKLRKHFNKSKLGRHDA